jgi:predicted nucleic-acid-binding Zn-ribbon protein
MKQGACPQCQGREVFEIDEVLQADYSSSNATYALTLAAHYGPTGEVGFFGDKMTRVEVRATAYVCASCAYTELYAKDLDRLAALADKRVGGVRKVKR